MEFNHLLKGKQGKRKLYELRVETYEQMVAYSVETELDEMTDDGRLGALAKHLAIVAGADWPSLDGDAQDAWHERAVEQVRKRAAGSEAA